MDTRQSEVIRIALLAGDEGAVLDHEFIDCTIKGPAVLAIQGEGRMNHCRFDGDPESLVWRLDQERVIGAILVMRCSFVGCSFENVGFAGNEELLNTFRNQ